MRILTYADLRDRGIPWSREHINIMIKGGKFPPSFQLSAGGRIVWDEAEIDAWLQERRAAVRINTRAMPVPQFGPRQKPATPRAPADVADRLC